MTKEIIGFIIILTFLTGFYESLDFKSKAINIKILFRSFFKSVVLCFTFIFVLDFVIKISLPNKEKAGIWIFGGLLIIITLYLTIRGFLSHFKKIKN